MSLAEQILEIWSIDAEVAATKHFLNKKKGYPNVCLTQSFSKKCSVAECKSGWFGLEHELPSTQLLFLSVRVNAIWTLKRNSLGLSIGFFQGFQSSENPSVNRFATVPPIAVVQVQDHRPQQPQTSPAALRKDHIEKSWHSASTSTFVKGFWFCWTPPSSHRDWQCLISHIMNLEESSTPPS